MNIKAAKIASLVMLTVSLLVTLFLLECAISGIFIIQAVPPVVVMFLFAAYWVWIDTVYLRCYQCLRNAQKQFPDNLNGQGIVLTALMGGAALSMWVVFFGSILVLGGFAPVMLNFLGIAVVFTVYTVMTLLILFALHKHSRTGIEPNCPRAMHFRIFRRAFTRKIGILLRKIPPKSIKNAFAIGCEQF